LPSERVATIDTSVILSLQCAGIIAAVSVLFDRILVPQAVRSEISAGGDQNQQASDALGRFAFFEPCNDYEPELVRLLLDTRTSLVAGRDQGEAEAVIQAAQRSAGMVLVDDALGRRWAEHHALECHGTLWIFDQLRSQGYVSSLRPRFEQLIRGRRRQPLDRMNLLLRKHDEPEITYDESQRLAG
jgi:predicted nucleic acid-binding protein